MKQDITETCAKCKKSYSVIVPRNWCFINSDGFAICRGCADEMQIEIFPKRD